jgi:hypothetical protein
VNVSSFSCVCEAPRWARSSTGRRAIDGAALRAELRARVLEHFTPLLAAFHAPVGCGSRALWRAATDQWAGAVWHMGLALGDEERAVAEATTLLPGGTPPFRGGADFWRIPLPGGDTRLTRTTLQCCRYYTLQPMPQGCGAQPEACITCPRTGADERVRRLIASEI